MKNKTFIIVEKDKIRPWITHLYYGFKGDNKHGDLTVSGAIMLDYPFIIDGVVMNVPYQELLYHRDLSGRILFDNRIF